ncbi:CBM_HP2_G0032300.mRNA.1.CDS.1 [Saccharomyces cerevisiae]|nr:CBM_HP2_G0032300.mRNA.1.CDS.1 [Saccharomyces cerevisiae]CAI6586404.1 CBM_HP2_G0032300.mRNA.1.CDS.1 [Saccharomyces cerevisiae]
MRPLLKVLEITCQQRMEIERLVILKFSNANPNTDEFSFKIRNTATGESFKFLQKVQKYSTNGLMLSWNLLKENAENHDLNAL